MKNPYDVLRQKELDAERLQKEIEALKIVAPLLAEEEKQIKGVDLKPSTQGNITTVAVLDAVPQSKTEVKTAPDWNNSAKRWP